MTTPRIETAPEIVRQQKANLLACISVLVLPAFRPRRKRRRRWMAPLLASWCART